MRSHSDQALLYQTLVIKYISDIRYRADIFCVGAMGSYVAFYLAGLYPLPGTRQFLLSSPYFPEISFTNPILGTTTTIRAKHFSGNPASGTGGNVFVKVCYQTSSHPLGAQHAVRASPSTGNLGNRRVSSIGMRSVQGRLSN